MRSWQPEELRVKIGLCGLHLVRSEEPVIFTLPLFPLFMRLFFFPAVSPRPFSLSAVHLYPKSRVFLFQIALPRLCERLAAVESICLLGEEGRTGFIEFSVVYVLIALCVFEVLCFVEGVCLCL